MTATLQLALALDPRVNDLQPAERAAHEAFVAYEDDHRADEASPAPRCRCRYGWTDDHETCGVCGRRYDGRTR